MVRVVYGYGLLRDIVSFLYEKYEVRCGWVFGLEEI